MQKKQVLLGLLVVSLLIINVAFLAYQDAKIKRLESNENISVNDRRDWGATIHMRIFRSGVFLSEESHHNVITNAARQALRGHIGDSAVAVWDYIAIGTGTGGGVGSTTLVTQFLRAQGTYDTPSLYNFTITYSWGPGNFSGQTITECGVFNAAVAGTMLNYDDDFSRGPLQSTDTLQVVVNFQIGS